MPGSTISNTLENDGFAVSFMHFELRKELEKVPWGERFNCRSVTRLCALLRWSPLEGDSKSKGL